MKGYITDVAAIAGLANRVRFGSGADAAGDLCRQYYYRPSDAAKYIFLTGQALLWMATIGAVIGYKSGLTGVPLILTGGIFGGVMAVLMPALAQPVVRRITGLTMWPWGASVPSAIWVQAAVAKLSAKASLARKISSCLITLSFCRIPIWPWRW
jgi:PTS system ascorbate-specific IIC component